MREREKGKRERERERGFNERHRGRNPWKLAVELTVL